MLAIDHDSGENGRVIYSLTSRGDLEDKFQIEALSGRIMLSSPLTESDVGKEIKLAIQASDNGKGAYISALLSFFEYILIHLSEVILCL